MKITVGKFDMWPGTVFKDVPVTSLPRRIQIASLDGKKEVLVSDFDGAGNNRVIIAYDGVDAVAQT